MVSLIGYLLWDVKMGYDDLDLMWKYYIFRKITEEEEKKKKKKTKYTKKNVSEHVS